MKVIEQMKNSSFDSCELEQELPNEQEIEKGIMSQQRDQKDSPPQPLSTHEYKQQRPQKQHPLPLLNNSPLAEFCGKDFDRGGNLLEDNNDEWYVQDLRLQGHSHRHDEPESARRIVLYKQLSTKSLLKDDDDEDAYIRDRFLQGLPQHSSYCDDRLDLVPVTHTQTDTQPHLDTVLEVFPDADRNHVATLLRQQSLTSTLVLLAEESATTTSCPSDDILLPPELQHATTYAQGVDEHRAIIMSYLTEMFPEIPPADIESVLMDHSTHQSVSILAKRSSSSSSPPLDQMLKPPPSAAPFVAAAGPTDIVSLKQAPRMTSRETDHAHGASLLEQRRLRSPVDNDDDDSWRPFHSRTNFPSVQWVELFKDMYLINK